MRHQTTLDSEIQRSKHTCPYCSKAFQSEKGMRLHITRMHLGKETFLYPDERVDISPKGNHVDVRITMRRSVWNFIKGVANQLNMSPSEYIMRLLILKTDEEEGEEVDKTLTYIT